MLRLVGWANIHQPMLDGCSTFNVMVDQCNQLHKVISGFHAYLFTRDRLSTYYKMHERFEQYPGISWLECGPKDHLKWRTLVDNRVIQAIHPEMSDIPYDLVWTADTTMSAIFSFCLMKRNGAWFFPIDIPIVAGLDEDLDEIGMAQYDPDTDLGRMMAFTGLLVADHPFVITKQQMEDVARYAKALLSPAKVAQLRNKLRLFHSPCVLDHIHDRRNAYMVQRKDRWEKTKQLVVFHQGTFEAKRHLPEVCKALDLLAVANRGKFKFLNCSQVTSGSLSILYMELDLRLGQTREQMHNALGHGDICLITSDRNCVGVGYAECIMSGMIPIGVNKRWCMERMPYKYPYMMDDIQSQLPALLKYIYNNREEALKWAAKARDSWMPWDVTVAAPKFGLFLADIAEANRKKCVPELFKFPSGWCIEKAIEKCPDRFTGFESVINRAAVAARDGGIALQRWPNTALRWMLLERGYVDEGGHCPTFRRV